MPLSPLELDAVTPATTPQIFVLEVRQRGDDFPAPIARLLIERDEQVVHGADGEVVYAVFRLSYERMVEGNVAREGGEFRASFAKNGSGARVSLTSLDGRDAPASLDLSGLHRQRIGTFLMNDVVRWAKQWPQATVTPFRLTDDVHDFLVTGRNRFFEQFGLRFDFDDATRRTGELTPMQVADLRPVPAGTFHNLRVVTMSEHLRFLDQRMAYANEQEQRLQTEVERLNRRVVELSNSKSLH